MTDLLRQEIAAEATALVVKVGTRVLTHADGQLNEERIRSLAEQLNYIRDAGKQVLLVSSGAVGAGMQQLQLDARPTDLAKLQAVAAIGQTKLIEAYDRTFRAHQRHAAQVLLTTEDLEDRSRYLNVRNTLLSLVEYGAIPVINENDTVAVDELMTTFGDNDRLAALVTTLLRSPLLVILSDVDGLYDGDPESKTSQRIPLVTELDDEVLGYARPQGSVEEQSLALSKGGMASKLQAAKMVTQAGESMIVASGRHEDVLVRILRGEDVGTLFLARGRSISPRKRWIGFSVQPRGKLRLDEGACRALAAQGGSLLAIGITETQGVYHKGDVVSLWNSQGQEIGRGLTNYSHAEIEKIRGRRSAEIAAILGHCPYQEVIHRDNLTLL